MFNSVLGGATVDLCRNVTDTDDHLLIEAKREGVNWLSLASQETYRFERDLAQLGVVRPAYEHRSRDYVDEVVVLGAHLLATGAAYERNRSVYFRGSDLVSRAGLDRDQAIDLARMRGGNPDDPDKDDPLDVAQWHRSVGDEPAWPSPWGPGRPGWHAECAAMSVATFGPTVDLHVGGEYLHDVLDRFPPGALRLLILSRHWPEPWEFDEAGLERAAAELESLWLRRSFRRPRHRRTQRRIGPPRRPRHPRALALAKEAGGQGLRDAVALLGLS